MVVVVVVGNVGGNTLRLGFLDSFPLNKLLRWALAAGKITFVPYEDLINLLYLGFIYQWVFIGSSYCEMSEGSEASQEIPKK